MLSSSLSTKEGNFPPCPCLELDALNNFSSFNCKMETVDMIYLKYLMCIDSWNPKDHLILVLVCRSEGQALWRRPRRCRLYKHFFEWKELSCFMERMKWVQAIVLLIFAFTVEMTKKLLRRESFPTFQHTPEQFLPPAKIPVMVELKWIRLHYVKYVIPVQNSVTLMIIPISISEVGCLLILNCFTALEDSLYP